MVTNISDNELINQYIKRIAPVGLERRSQIAYYESELFVDLYINPEHYMISNFGRIYSKYTNKIINPNLGKDGFYRTEPISGNSRRSFYYHDLVMMSFAYRPDYNKNSDFLIKHLNGNKLMNVYCPGHPCHNLEWSDSVSYLQFIYNILPKDYNEEFRPFPLDRRYLISNKGKVFSLINDTFMMQKIDKNGYCRIELANKIYSIHRLIMITFAYRPDYELLEVNHIDGIKTNNIYFGLNNPETNLEWCTNEENMKHAANHNLVRYGNNHPSSIFTEQFIESICEIINNNPYITSTEIAEKLQIQNSSQFSSLVSQLRCGTRWRRVVEKYPNVCRVEHLSKYTEPFVDQICQIINENPKLTAPEIANILNCEYTESFQRLIHKLKNGETWLKITSKYPNVVKERNG